MARNFDGTGNLGNHPTLKSASGPNGSFGVLGGLAQSRKRFLIVARHLDKVPPFLQLLPRPLHAVGGVLGRMPLPGDMRAGPMHRMTFGLALCATLWAGACLSQTLPDAAAELQRQEQQRQQLRQRQETSPDVHLRAPATVLPDRLPLEESPCQPVTMVRIVRAPGTLAGLHQALSGPDGNDSPTGHCIGVQGCVFRSKAPGLPIQTRQPF